jgi:hypothetical protein
VSFPYSLSNIEDSKKQKRTHRKGGSCSLSSIWLQLFLHRLPCLFCPGFKCHWASLCGNAKRLLRRLWVV